MTAALHRDIAAVAAALDEARTQADAGAPIDLAGLEARVAELCAAAVETRDATAAPGLEALLRALHSLAESLTRQRDSMAAAAEGRPDPHTARQRAAAVYGRGAALPASDTTPEEPS
ncbi:hypothetical protein [Azospirillum sp. sgz302134]